MPAQHPVYHDITRQAATLEQAIAYHRGPGQAALEQAAAALRQAFRLRQPVVVVGIGASYAAAVPFVHRLAAGGHRVQLEDASEYLHYTHRAGLEPAVLILVSRSGSTIEITRLLERVQAGGQTVIGITNVPDSPLAMQANVTLLLGGPNDDLIAIQTYQTTLLALALLADAVLTAVGDWTAELAPAVAATVASFQAHSREWRSRMRPFQAAYLLGRGPALASALEGALLFHEMARFPAVAVSAGAFRHGMWEVADQRLRCFIFAPPDETYDLNIALALDLARQGADTTLIAAQPQGAALPEGVHIWQIPKSGPNSIPFLQIIPLQLFTYELALWQGLTPGQFRLSTQVTLSEGGESAGEAS